jgi:hypothetical protein
MKHPIHNLIKQLVKDKKDIIALTNQPTKTNEELLNEIIDSSNLLLNKPEYDELLIYITLNDEEIPNDKRLDESLFSHQALYRTIVRHNVISFLQEDPIRDMQYKERIRKRKQLIERLPNDKETGTA